MIAQNVLFTKVEKSIIREHHKNTCNKLFSISKKGSFSKKKKGFEKEYPRISDPVKERISETNRHQYIQKSIDQINR